MEVGLPVASMDVVATATDDRMHWLWRLRKDRTRHMMASTSEGERTCTGEQTVMILMGCWVAIFP
jgi:hypothetical protein